MNLLDHFFLQHVQVTELNAQLVKMARKAGTQEAKVELNLTPRLLKADSGSELPAYQVSARLSCQGGAEKKPDPSFKAHVSLEVIYQQMHGEPIDIAQFTASHASLTRQLYPLLQHQLRDLLNRLGLEQVHLPFDLASKSAQVAGQPVEISGAVH